MTCYICDTILEFLKNVERTADFPEGTFIEQIIEFKFPNIFFIGAGNQTNEIRFLEDLKEYGVNFKNITMHDRSFQEKYKIKGFNYTTEKPEPDEGTIFVAFNIGVYSMGSTEKELLEDKKKSELLIKAYENLGSIHFFDRNQNYEYTNYAVKFSKKN